MAKYLLTIGDDVIDSGSKSELLPKYNNALKTYEQSNFRPSKQPLLWVLEEKPNK